jgi:hypothetical protein
MTPKYPLALLKKDSFNDSIDELHTVLKKWERSGIPVEDAVQTLLYFSHNFAFSMSHEPHSAVGMIQEIMDSMVDVYVNDEDYLAIYNSYHLRGEVIH